jgi:hypothetical protein
MSVSSPSCAGAQAFFQHTAVQAICHRAQAHELFILATMAKNVDNETLMRKRTSYPLAIVRKRTSY